MNSSQEIILSYWPKYIFLQVVLFDGIQNLEMKTDEKIETKAAKRDKAMWKPRNGLTQTQKVLKGLFSEE